MHKVLFLIFCLLINTKAFSQDLKAVRMEVPSDINANAFNVLTIGEDGMLIFYVSNETDNEKKRLWYFGLFDSGLKQQWLKFVPLADNIEYVTSIEKEKNIYFFFKSMRRDRSDYAYYEIVNYNIAKQEFSKISGSIPAKSEYAGFDIIDNIACLALNLNRNKTDLVFINLNNGELSPVHINDEDQGYIEAVYADPFSKKFYVALKQTTDRRYINEYLMGYTLTGEQFLNLKISNTEPLKYFKDYVFKSTRNGELFVFGIYNIVNGRSLSFKDLDDDNENTSAGIFFMKFINDEQKGLKYYDFMGFDNISGAIGPNSFITSKKAYDTLSGNKNNKQVTAAFYLNMPEVDIANNGNYIFSVEVFKPYYKTETRMDYDFYGRPYPYTYNVFSGYNYYDVIVVEISQNGQLMWSNDFPIEDMLTFSSSRKSIVTSDDDLVSLAYVNNGNIVSQTIEQSMDIERSKTKIGTDFSQDRVTQEENSHIVHWYGDYFLIYGYQKLKNRTLGDNSTRTVFYANKVAYK